jgi:hypothetical protein
MFLGKGCLVKKHPGRALAVGILCAIAATVTLWSGPLASASSALHTSTPTHVQLSPASSAGR